MLFLLAGVWVDPNKFFKKSYDLRLQCPGAHDWGFGRVQLDELVLLRAGVQRAVQPVGSLRCRRARPNCHLVDIVTTACCKYGPRIYS